MAESFNSKRAVFPEGKQKELIDRIILKLSIREMANICKISERTIRDWRREKYSMDLYLLRKLCNKTSLTFPPKVELRKRYWYTVNGSSAGGLAVFRKYGRIGGNPDYRKKRWYEWWERKGKYESRQFTTPKPIKKPFYSADLAEFIGIVLGDGAISRYQITITLNAQNEEEYSRYVVSLAKGLFGVPVGISYCKKDSVIDLIISRSELVRYCTERLGLKKGNKVKQQVDIPEWIKRRKQYSIACLRGLVDTDGCIFLHRYKAKRKWYAYKKLSFSNRSKPLLYSVFSIFKKLKMSPRITKDGKDVRLESEKDLQQYFSVVGSHNPKYLKKYKK